MEVSAAPQTHTGSLRFIVTDDGTGFDTGLQGRADRLPRSVEPSRSAHSQEMEPS